MVSVSKFSSETYWTEFDVTDDDLDVIYNLLLDREVPLTTVDMMPVLIEHGLVRLEEEAQQAAEADYSIYLPINEYKINQMLLFPTLGNVLGTVVGVRPGDNPEISSFDVIQVKIEDNEQVREFATRLEDHILNHPPVSEVDVDELNSIDGVLRRYGALIEERLEARLNQAEDIVRIAGRWFPKALLADINEGHINLAEAVLDVAGGGPFPTTDLLEQIELASDLDPLLMEFSLDYALQEDESFDEVGPAGEVLWFLKRLEPPEVLYTPPRLESASTLVNRSLLTDDLLALEQRLDDELSPLTDVVEGVEEVTLAVLAFHQPPIFGLFSRVGTGEKGTVALVPLAEKE